MFRLALAFVAIFLVSAVVACGGGGGGGTPSVTVTATATPSPNPMPTISAVIPETGATVALPSIGGFNSSILFAPLNTSITANLTAQVGVPSGIELLPSARTAARRRVQNLPTIDNTGLFSIAMWLSDPVKMASFPGFTFTLPAGTSNAGPFFVGFYDPTNPGWQEILGPGSVNGQIVSFTSNTPPVSFVGKESYYFVLYAAGPSPTPSPPQSPTPSPVPTLAGVSYGLAKGFVPASGPIVGPDDNLWVAEYDIGSGDAIVKTTAAGVEQTYLVPNGFGYSGALTVGPDSALWFVFRSGNDGNPEIARVSTNGTFTEYALPSSDWFGQIMTSGSDGNLWYVALRVDSAGDSALRAVSPANGAIVANLILPIGTYGTPESIVTNPKDGALIIATSSAPGALLRVVPSATPVATFAYQGPAGDTDVFSSLSFTGGGIWGVYTDLTGTGQQQLFEVNESSYAVSYVTLPAGTYNPGSGCALAFCPFAFGGPIALGPDGNFYLGGNGNPPQSNAVGIAAVTSAGDLLAFYPINGATSQAGNTGMVVGADGNIWNAFYLDMDTTGCCFVKVAPFGSVPAARIRRP
jgi:hypothetical protein